MCYVMWYGQKMWWMIYVMYEIDHILVIGITTCMSMSMTTGRSHRSCLYYFAWPACHWITPCNCFSLSLCVSNSCRSNSWRRQPRDDTMIEIMMMEIMASCRWQRWSWCPEDGDQRSMMILAISCHYLIACDVYLVLHLICLERW